MLRNHHEIDAEAVGPPKNCAEVLWIGDAVENEDEGRLRAIDDFIKVGVALLRNLGDDAVVHSVAGQAIDLICGQHADGDAGALRVTNDTLHFPTVLAGHGNIADPIGMRADCLQDRIYTVDDHDER